MIIYAIKALRQPPLRVPPLFCCAEFNRLPCITGIYSFQRWGHRKENRHGQYRSVPRLRAGRTQKENREIQGAGASNPGPCDCAKRQVADRGIGTDAVPDRRQVSASVGGLFWSRTLTQGLEGYLRKNGSWVVDLDNQSVFYTHAVFWDKKRADFALRLESQSFFEGRYV